jgi:hypothetical protein
VPINTYVQIKNSFQFLECAVRRRGTLSECEFPYEFKGRPADSALRDYILCQMLVSVVAQLESDIRLIAGVPGLGSAGSLSAKLRLLRDHFQISDVSYSAVDQVRDARNRFVHQGEFSVNPGCTKAELPGVLVSFLRKCQHPNF